MARKLRVEFEGAMYHVTVRGVERRNLFRGDWDRERLLAKLEEGVERYELDVFLYCLMSNHVHLLVGTPRGNLSRFMGWWQTAYTVYFNRKYNRSGHLTQGRYGEKLVEGDEYLLALSRYIHLNPIQTAPMRRLPVAERVAALHGYRWSSFPGYVSARKAKSFVRYGPLLDLVGAGRKQPRRAYRQFVEQGVGLVEEEWRELQEASRIAIGSERFIEEMESLYTRLVDGRSQRENASFRRLGHRVDPAVVIAVIARMFGVSEEEVCMRRRNVWDRAVASRYLVQYSGMTQGEVGERLSLGTGSAVSAQMRSLSEALKTDGSLRRVVMRVEEELAAVAANF